MFKLHLVLMMVLKGFVLALLLVCEWCERGGVC